MSNVAITVGLVVLLAALNVPIWMALIGGSIPYFFFLDSGVPMQILAQRAVAVMESNSYLAIPFFITAGCIMNISGITKRLLDLADGIVGHRPGGLGHINVLLSALNGGISGSAVADAAVDCKILVPEMLARGYAKDFSAAVTVASALITPIIPPGIGMIIFGFVTNTSIGKLFCAGYIPGIIGVILMMLYVEYVSRKNGYKSSRERRATWKELLILFRNSIWALMAPFGIILGIRFGVCTASEAGAILAWFCLIVGMFIYKEIKVSDLIPVVVESLLSTATVMILICSANVFAYFLTFENIGNDLVNFIMSLNLGKVGFLLLTNVILLLIGMFMEGGAPMIVLGPMLMPIALKYGIDPVHFGIMFVFNLGIGNMSPPFGLVLYQVCSTLDIDIVTMSKAVVPFLVIMVITLMIITFCPGLVMFIPNLIYGA